jgi:hypothetical protein
MPAALAGIFLSLFCTISFFATSKGQVGGKTNSTYENAFVVRTKKSEPPASPTEHIPNLHSAPWCIQSLLY